jgi:hypothetical protein
MAMFQAMAECLEATNGGAFFLIYLTPEIKAGIWFRSNSSVGRRIRKCLLTKKEDLLAYFSRQQSKSPRAKPL